MAGEPRAVLEVQLRPIDGSGNWFRSQCQHRIGTRGAERRDVPRQESDDGNDWGLKSRSAQAHAIDPNVLPGANSCVLVRGCPTDSTCR
jgi:hypothetical protein